MKINFNDFIKPKERYLKTFHIDEQKWNDYVWVLKKIIQTYEPNFVFTEEIQDVYKNLLLYFLGSDQSKYDLDKGIYIYGNTGSGKSLILQHVFKQFTANLGYNSYRVIPSYEIIKNVEKNGLDSISNYVLSENKQPITLYIDDFGSGNHMVNSFGTIVNVYAELIINRYPYFNRNGLITHFSSNIKPKLLSEYFDERISSRMAEMCNVIKLNSVDYRRL